MAMPLDLLEETLNKKLILTLKDGRVMEGTLVGYDQYMNVVLEDTQELRSDEKRAVGTVILRGNNIVSMVYP
jgi:small nuclear ribonucleoprotein